MRDPRIHIVRARERSLGKINRLIARSKRYWNWPPAYLEAALLLHVLTTDYLQTNHCFEVLATDGALIGFCSVVADNPRMILDNLWVTPDLIGRGVGRRTCEHLFRFAREQGWTELWVVPDAPAEGFYRKVGGHGRAGAFASARRARVLRLSRSTPVSTSRTMMG
jgi:N-acetylglutamate synthase-like GNAT family acetyltransferase